MSTINIATTIPSVILTIMAMGDSIQEATTGIIDDLEKKFISIELENDIMEEQQLGIGVLQLKAIKFVHELWYALLAELLNPIDEALSDEQDNIDNLLNRIVALEELVTAIWNLIDAIGTPFQYFTELLDVPNSYAEQYNKILTVNLEESGLIFSPANEIKINNLRNSESIKRLDAGPENEINTLLNTLESEWTTHWDFFQQITSYPLENPPPNHSGNPVNQWFTPTQISYEFYYVEHIDALIVYTCMSRKVYKYDKITKMFVVWFEIPDYDVDGWMIGGRWGGWGPTLSWGGVYDLKWWGDRWLMICMPNHNIKGDYAPILYYSIDGIIGQQWKSHSLLEIYSSAHAVLITIMHEKAYIFCENTGWIEEVSKLGTALSSRGIGEQGPWPGRVTWFPCANKWYKMFTSGTWDDNYPTFYVAYWDGSTIASRTIWSSAPAYLVYDYDDYYGRCGHYSYYHGDIFPRVREDGRGEVFEGKYLILGFESCLPWKSNHWYFENPPPDFDPTHYFIFIWDSYLNVMQHILHLTIDGVDMNLRSGLTKIIKWIHFKNEVWFSIYKNGYCYIASMPANDSISNYFFTGKFANYPTEDGPTLALTLKYKIPMMNQNAWVKMDWIEYMGSLYIIYAQDRYAEGDSIWKWRQPIIRRLSVVEKEYGFEKKTTISTDDKVLLQRGDFDITGNLDVEGDIIGSVITEGHEHVNMNQYTHYTNRNGMYEGRIVVAINDPVDGLTKVEYADHGINDYAYKVLGMSMERKALGEDTNILVEGEVSIEDFEDPYDPYDYYYPIWNWIPGQPIYLVDDGKMSQTPPTNNGTNQFFITVGFALTQTKIFIRIEPPVLFHNV